MFVHQQPTGAWIKQGFFGCDYSQEVLTAAGSRLQVVVFINWLFVRMDVAGC